jgi:hypothetical protein
MRANEACATAARTLHTCMAGSKGAVKASKSSVSLSLFLFLFLSRFLFTMDDSVSELGLCD